MVYESLRLNVCSGATRECHVIDNNRVVTVARLTPVVPSWLFGAAAAAAGCVRLSAVHQVDFGEDVCIFGENLFISLTNEIERVSSCLIRSQQGV